MVPGEAFLGIWPGMDFSKLRILGRISPEPAMTEAPILGAVKVVICVQAEQHPSGSTANAVLRPVLGVWRW